MQKKLPIKCQEKRSNAQHAQTIHMSSFYFGGGTALYPRVPPAAPLNLRRKQYKSNQKQKSRLWTPAGCLWLLVFLGSWVPWLYCAFTVDSSCFFGFGFPVGCWFLTQQYIHSGQQNHNTMTAEWQAARAARAARAAATTTTRSSSRTRSSRTRTREQSLDTGVGFPSLGLWMWSQE